ncbi:MAG TPA: sulfite exporter TauE/SafE family protein [Bacteroidota bacterium]|nr:sulfite exporter TauE/SafE family protein [Bacteroidota bacterium]
MSYYVLSSLLFAGSLLAGLLGALTGLGGGVVIIPLITLAFGIDIRYAIGASLISVIATSSGAAAAYVREGYTNIRIGMFLEVATTLGALGGAALAGLLSTGTIAVVFGIVLASTALQSLRTSHDVSGAAASDRSALRLRLNGEYPLDGLRQRYNVTGVLPGFALMLIAGGLSGLLGIGSGAVKVLAMDRIMRIPFKVSTTTSNFMIGVTAAASAGIYIARGYVAPEIAMPVMLGVLAGSLAGSRALVATRTVILRRLFAWVVIVLAAEMIFNGMTGRI